MKKLITLFLIVVLALPTYLAIGQGQNIVVFKGNGTSNTNVCPIPGGYNYHYYLNAISQATLGAAGITGQCLISKLAFELHSASSSSATKTMKIYLKEVTPASFTVNSNL